MRHVLTVPISLVLLYWFEPKKPIKKDAMKFVLFIIVGMIISYFFGSANLNCSRAFCAPILDFSGPMYFVGWTSIIVVVSLLSLCYIIYPLHKFIRKIRLV